MSLTLRTPRITREEFLDWAALQEERYEFDGFEPVAMTGGLANHSLISHNIYAALRSRLRGGPYRTMGPDAGLATIGGAVRYPDALITCSPFAGSDRLIPGVTAVFEVLSPNSGRVDRIEKAGEDLAVPSILSYAILEYGSAAASMLTRTPGGTAWTLQPLTETGTLRLPAPDIAIPLAEFYEGIAFG